MWPFTKTKQNYEGYQPTEDTLDHDNPPQDTGTAPKSKSELISKPSIVSVSDYITDIVLINNRTDQPYEVKSINEYGLDIDARQGNPLIVIRQKNNVDGTNFRIAGIYRDFSITKINWKTPTPVKEEETT